MVIKPKADGMNYNSLGTTQVSNPDHGALKFSFRYATEGIIIEDDPSKDDLELPSREQEGLTKFLTRLGYQFPDWKTPVPPKRSWKQVWEEMRFVERATPVPRFQFENAPKLSLPEQEKLLDTLRDVFADEGNFSYTLDLKPDDRKPAVTQFLFELKKGHCEYYATATALLLRRAGIPTRYVVGYAVEEQGDEPGEWVLRGKHAHAWVQAYLGGEWVNEGEADDPVWRCRGGEWVVVDNTPSSWLADGVGTDGWKLAVLDWFQTAREDLILWFSRPLVSLITKIAFIVFAVGLVIYLIIRLTTTRRKGSSGSKANWGEQVRSWNRLRDFEKWLGKRVGPRPEGMPMGDWLKEHLAEEGKALREHHQALVFDPKADDSHREAIETEVRRLKKLKTLY
jgi:hypothetical protein